MSLLKGWISSFTPYETVTANTRLRAITFILIRDQKHSKEKKMSEEGKIFSCVQNCVESWCNEFLLLKTTTWYYSLTWTVSKEDQRQELKCLLPVCCYILSEHHWDRFQQWTGLTPALSLSIVQQSIKINSLHSKYHQDTTNDKNDFQK